MKVALIVLWTLAAGVFLFLMVRARIVRATEALTRDAARTRPDPTPTGETPREAREGASNRPDGA